MDNKTGNTAKYKNIEEEFSLRKCFQAHFPLPPNQQPVTIARISPPAEFRKSIWFQ